MGSREEVVRARIEHIVAGGLGLARVDGRVVLVEDSAPGDLLDVRVSERHRSWMRGRPLRILEAGSGRREPPCPHARRCGGCDFQHLGYDAQIEAKLAILRESFRRVGKLDLSPDIAVERSPEWGYRRRARFHLARARDGTVRLGFHARHGHEVVEIGPCPVLTPALESALPALREAAGSRREIEALDGESGVVEGREIAVVIVGGDRLEVSASAFFQSSSALLEVFRARVSALAGAGPSAVDLYAGVGLFTLPLARRFARVVAVEGATGAARLAARNAERAGLGNVEVVPSSVEEALRGSAGEAACAGVVVLDPPRAGLGPKLVDTLVGIAPRRIVYVACDPVALARDAGRLVAGGFGLGPVELFDLFPQTHHFETVAVFEGPPLLS